MFMGELYTATHNIIANVLLEIYVTLNFKHEKQDFCSHILSDIMQPQLIISSLGKIIGN